MQQDVLLNFWGIFPTSVFPTSVFSHFRFFLYYWWTLSMNLISKPYRWTLVLNLIGITYWWTLFMNLICSIWQNLINSPTLFINLIREPYWWTLFMNLIFRFFQLPVFSDFQFFTTYGFSTSSFSPLPVFITSGFVRFRFWTKPEMVKNRKLEKTRSWGKNRSREKRKIRFMNKVHQ